LSGIAGLGSALADRDLAAFAEGFPADDGLAAVAPARVRRGVWVQDICPR
jgi:hypothetical protein